MARGIVQSRPFIKQKRQQANSAMTRMAWFSQGKKMQKSEFLSFFLKKYVLIIAIILLLLLLGLFILKGTVYNPSYQIQTIQYPPSTRAKYENTELFVLASKFLRGKYYSALQVGGTTDLLSAVRGSYPFVRNATIKYQDSQTIAVDFEFYEPDFLIKLGEKRFWVWRGAITEELDPTRSLGQSAFVVDTPAYLSGTTSLSGFFAEVDYARYMNYLPMIQETFPTMQRFVYLAGSANFIIFDQSKMIFLHKEDVPHQLQKYRRLQQYFPNFSGVSEIDLGSLTQDKVIIRE